MGWLSQILFWHWWVVAALLVMVEILRPSVIFLWLGFAAAAVGFLLLVFPSTTLRAQLAMFGLLCLISVLAWLRYRRRSTAGLSQRR